VRGGASLVLNVAPTNRQRSPLRTRFELADVMKTLRVVPRSRYEQGCRYLVAPVHENSYPLTERVRLGSGQKPRPSWSEEQVDGGDYSNL